MKKILIFLWIIIIGGGILIIKHFLSPENIAETPPTFTENSANSANPPNENNLISDIPIENSNIENKADFGKYVVKGDNFFIKKQYSSAIKEYLKAFKSNPDSPEIIYKLGKGYLKNNQTKEAIEILKKGAITAPQSIDMQITLAQAFINSRQIEAAKNLIWKLDPDNPKVKYYTGIILILFKDFAGAKNIFIELANQQNQNAEIFVKVFENFELFRAGESIFLQTLLAQALTQVEQYEAAIPLLFDVLTRKKNYRDAWIVLGYAYLNTGKFADALDALNQAKILDPAKEETLFYWEITQKLLKSK